MTRHDLSVHIDREAETELFIQGVQTALTGLAEHIVYTGPDLSEEQRSALRNQMQALQGVLDLDELAKKGYAA